MRKTSFEYHIHGYRYAPESFHIYKGLPGQEKTELPLSDEQRYQMGYLYLTQGIKSAVDYVKHIERERERKCRLYMTYGFMLKENPCSYVYCALPGFVDSKNEEKTERNAGYLVVSHSGGGMLRQGTRKGIRRTPANRGMRAHRIVKSLDISEDVCHGLCP